MTVIASWNVNSIRVRENHVKNFIEKVHPDILLLQEIKCMNEEFPEFLKNSSYKFLVNGQKAKYGVAIIYKENLSLEEIDPKNEILQKEARVQVVHIDSLRLNLINIYTPNGNPLNDNQKFNFKMKWFEELTKYCGNLLQNKQDVIIGGDFNVIENVKDAVDFNQWRNDALGHINTRTKFRLLCSQGYTNLSRVFYEPGKIFSFWDYQRACWERNDGILIDHFLVSPRIVNKVERLEYESVYRGMEKPSDHIPFWIKLNI